MNDTNEEILELKSQYKFLKGYTFLWWAWFSMVLVFQNVYFISIGIKLYQVFFNAAISVVFSMFVVNFWSKLSDKSGYKKKFIIFGNITRASSFIFLAFVNSPWMMIVYTMIFYAGPSSDGILISYIYEISDKLNPEIKEERPVYSKIHNYAQIRKFGSIGWASMLPFSGWIINLYGFQVNFFIAGTLMLVITLIFSIKFNESLIKTSIIEINSDVFENTHNIKENVRKNSVKLEKDSLFTNIKKILQNKQFKIFIIVTFFATISASLASTIFSIFNSKFSNDNYILLGLTWSINAFIEFPVMNMVARRVEKNGWQNIIIITYLLSTVRLMLNPIALFLNVNIMWIYVFQIINGFTFGLSWPATTYGLNSNLDKENKSLGMTFYDSIKQIGTFTGNIIGQLFAYLILDENTFYFVLFAFASIISLLAAAIFHFQNKRHKS